MILAVLGTLVSACGTGSPDPQAACDQAIAQAMAIDPASDTVRAVDGAIAGCRSLETWVAAARRYPDTYVGRDPASLARQRCGASAGLATTPVCVEIQANR